MADLLGLAGSDQANSKAVQRALNNYEFDSITIGRHLFEFKRGGGKSKTITSYGANFLNQAALWIVRELSHSPSLSANLTALIDELVPEAVNKFIPRRLSKIDDLSSTRLKARRRKRPHNPKGGSLLLNGHFCPPSEKCEAALNLVARGFQVFPLHSAPDGQCSCKHGGECPTPGKHPRIRGWIQAATNIPEVVRLWWTKWPDANIAVKTGTRVSSGGFLAVLDMDRRSFGHGSLACWIEDIGEQITETFTVTAGDGSHFYYSVPELVNCSSGQLGRGLDIKCQHGYVVATGSIHVNGTPYTVLSNSSIMPMPIDMFNLLRSTGSVRQTVPVGERHNFLMRCARRLAHEGFDPLEIQTTLVDRLTRFCEAGGRTVSDEELARLTTWAHNVEHRRTIQTEVA